jgi:hypothetical protein
MSGSLHNRHEARTNQFGFIEKPFDNMQLTALVESSFQQLFETGCISTELLRADFERTELSKQDSIGWLPDVMKQHRF